MHLNFSDIIAAISLFWTAITFGRTVRHRPEASWMNSYIVTRLRNATPPLTDEHGRRLRAPLAAWWRPPAFVVDRGYGTQRALPLSDMQDANAPFPAAQGGLFE